jgi:hypothetical protein
MATAVEIWNSGIILVGLEEILSFEDQSNEAKLGSVLYDTIKQNALQAHPWRFSIKQKVLSRAQDDPLNRFERSFILPSDSLRIIDTYPNMQYEIFENRLFTDQTEVSLEYQFDPGEQRYPVYFRHYLELRSAQYLASAALEDVSKTNAFRNLADEQERRARNIDSQQQPPFTPDDSSYSLLNARSS